jgi:methyl-accepting chemotaxis protein
MSDKIEELLHQSKKLEENVISSLTDSNSDVEIILKELLVYLNATSHGLSQIQSAIDALKEPMYKIDIINSDVSKIKDSTLDYPREFQKVIDEQSKETAQQLKEIIEPLRGFTIKLSEYVKSMAAAVRDQAKKTDSNSKNIYVIENNVDQLSKDLQSAKNEILKSQEGLYKVIDSILKSSNEGLKANLGLQTTQIKSQTDLQKQKRDFWLKIIGYIMGSGGLIYFIINMIMGSGSA